MERLTEQAMDKETLVDWYIRSVDENYTPQWTEEHIDELLQDYIVIPKSAVGYGQLVVLPDSINESVKAKIRKTIDKIARDGAGGLICIIL